jgi:hypothetical protein
MGDLLVAGAAFNHATGKKYQKVVNKGTDMAVKKYVESQGKQQQQQPQQQQQYGRLSHRPERERLASAD